MLKYLKISIFKFSLASLAIFSFLAPALAPLADAALASRGGAISAGTDPFWDKTVLLVGNDNNLDTQTSFIDQSRYIRTITTNGNAQWDTAQAPTGLTSSLLLDGSGDYLSATDDADLEMGSSSFTIEGWTRWNSTAAPNRTIYSKRAAESSIGGIQIQSSGTTMQWFATSNNSTWDIASEKSFGTITTGQWYHWALVRNGNTWTPYLNGVAGSGTVTSSATVADNTAAVRIGSDSDTQSFDGWIAAVRVTKGVARYTANFTPPTLPLKVGTFEPIVATGGTITTVGNYKVHTFTSSGTFRVLRGNGPVWYLVVAGGGAGINGVITNGVSGGGGGGGFRTNNAYDYPVSTGNYTVTVGSGAVNANGADSVFATITSTGGGKSHTAGGSGGGGSTGVGAGGSGVAGQGKNGGAVAFQAFAAGGGGGAGTVGADGVPNCTPGNGGNGLQSSISGSTAWYAGGGGGGTNCTVGFKGLGGTGGGGNGSYDGGAATNGAANTGGGGGGDCCTSTTGGAGGSGVVIIRYPVGSTKSKIQAKDALVGHWSFDDLDRKGTTVYDRSGFGYNGTLENGAAATTSIIRGRAISFDGINDFVSLPIPAQTYPVTIAFWAKPDTASPIGMFDSAPGSGNVIRNYGPGVVEWWNQDPGVALNLTAGEWVHLAFVYNWVSGIGRQLTYYKNGVLQTTGTGAGGSAIAWTSFRLGDINNGGDGRYSGALDDFRIYNRILSAAEIKKLYSSTLGGKVNTSLNDKLTSGLVGLWSFDGKDVVEKVYDRSGQGNHGYFIGGATSTAKTIGKLGQALKFDGTDDYVSVGSNNIPGNGAVSESLWVNFRQSAAGNSYHILTDLNRTTDLVFYLDDTSGTELMKFGHRSGGTTDAVQWNISSIYSSQWKDKWKHLVAVYNGGATDSADSYSLYVDGVLYTTSKALVAVGGSTAANYIGIDSVPVAGYLNGVIDDVRTYNRALSAAEVKQLYNMGR